MPTAFLDFSGGDGLVEVAGAIGVLITMGVLVRGVDDRGAANQTGTIRWQLVALAGVCFGLTTLTSPGGTLAVVIGVSALVGNMIIRKMLASATVSDVQWRLTKQLRPLLVGCVVALIGTVVSAPWWLVVARRHGFRTLLNAAGSRGTFLGNLYGVVLFNRLY